jgi:type II secretory pathway pseudopilin PulG
MVDLVVVLVLIGVVMGMVAPLGRRIIASYQLNSATQTLLADLSQAKIRAIQSNSIVRVERPSRRLYQMPGTTRQLPASVRFKSESVASVAYNGLGTLTQPSEGVRKFVLTNVYGKSREIRMYPGGGCEMRKGP